MIGALFTVLSFAALIHTNNVRAPFVSPELRSISADVENLRRVRADVESLMMALTPHREQPAETTRALEEMRTDLRTLVCTACEALDSAERSRKDSQEATSAALEGPGKAAGFLPSGIPEGSSRSPGKRTDAGKPQSILCVGLMTAPYVQGGGGSSSSSEGRNLPSDELTP
jgi:hypothetical protein